MSQEPQLTIIPLGDALKRFTALMLPHIGVETFYNNYSGIIYQIVEQLLFGDVMANPWVIVKQVEGYGVDAGSAEDLVFGMRVELMKIFNRTLQLDTENKTYDIALRENGDLYVTCFGNRNKISVFEEALKSVKDDLDSGGWYPEKIRRAVGV